MGQHSPECWPIYFYMASKAGRRLSIWIPTRDEPKVSPKVSELQMAAESLGLRLDKSDILRKALYLGLKQLTLESYSEDD